MQEGWKWFVVTAAIETRSLEHMLEQALGLRRQPVRTLARAILDGHVNFPIEPLDLPHFVCDDSSSLWPDNAPLRASHFLMWLTGTGLEQAWLDEIVAALRNEVTHLRWFSEKQVLCVEFD